MIENAVMFLKSLTLQDVEEDTILQLIFDAKTLMKLFPHEQWKDIIVQLEQKVTLDRILKI
jgi:hypothetical protein